jgi:ATP synthase subunit 6
MTQPLEQFINFYYLFCDLKGLFYIEVFFFNKYIVVVLLILFLFYCLTLFSIQTSFLRIFNILLIFYNRIMLEMINVVSFNFIFFSLLYFSLFIYIYLCNLVGLLPNTPCFTTQIFGNLMLSFTLIIGITILNIDKNGFMFFDLFVPKGVPSFLIPFLFCLEMFSYFIRILSLSIRLFSNMVAGHSLLHILFDMVSSVKVVLEGKLDLLFVGFVVLIALIIVIILFELIVAFLQAYVFSIMLCIYFNDLLLSH